VDARVERGAREGVESGDQRIEGGGVGRVGWHKVGTPPHERCTAGAQPLLASLGQAYAYADAYAQAQAYAYAYVYAYAYAQSQA
jgi:hypothetical protein